MWGTSERVARWMRAKRRVVSGRVAVGPEARVGAGGDAAVAIG